MATFTLSGSGTHAITAGTGALHVHVTTLPTIRGAGRAEPTNYYDLGLLRLGDGTYWWPSIPIDAEFQLLGCPQGTLEIAYALFNGTQLSVVEVAGANPLAGSRALEDLSDVLIASVADGQVLSWNASAGKWENITPSGSTGGMTLLASSELVADAGSITFSAISSAHKALRLECSFKLTGSAQLSFVQFNGDTGANYDGMRHDATSGGGHGAVGFAGEPRAEISFAGSAIALSCVDIPFYAGGLSKAFTAVAMEGDAAGGTVVRVITGLWRSTAAINEITLFPGAGAYASGSAFYLFGLG